MYLCFRPTGDLPLVLSSLTPLAGNISDSLKCQVVRCLKEDQSFSRSPSGAVDVEKKLRKDKAANCKKLKQSAKSYSKATGNTFHVQLKLYNYPTTHLPI